jgi:hypothetical protein
LFRAPNRFMWHIGVQHSWLADEKAAIDPALAGLRFLGEFPHQVAVELERAKTRRRVNFPSGFNMTEALVERVVGAVREIATVLTAV